MFSNVAQFNKLAAWFDSLTEKALLNPNSVAWNSTIYKVLKMRNKSLDAQTMQSCAIWIYITILLTLEVPRVTGVTWFKFVFALAAGYVLYMLKVHCDYVPWVNHTNQRIDCSSITAFRNFGDICSAAHTFCMTRIFVCSNCSVHRSFVKSTLIFCFPW